MNKFKYSSDKISDKSKNELYKCIPNISVPFNNTYFFKLYNLLKKYNISTINKSDLVIKLGKDQIEKWEILISYTHLFVKTVQFCIYKSKHSLKKKN